MVSHLFFYQLMFLGLLWLCVMLHYAWPNACPGGDQKPSKPLPPPGKRSSDPQPFPGLTRKPPCAACEHAPAPHPHAPAAPLPRLVPPRGRRRQVDTSAHFCPNPDCAYRGWVGWGVVYPTAADNYCAPKTGYNALISPSSAGALPWYQPSFSTSAGSLHWCGSSSCSMGCGPTTPLPVANRSRHPSHPAAPALTTSNRLWA